MASKTRWFLRRLLFGALLSACAAGPGLAADPVKFPDRPVKIVVPAAAGGALDIISRILANKASEIWGQTVFVENKPGANWQIGMEAVAKSPPDGYTLLFVASSGITINPYVFPNMKIDPLKDFIPLTVATDTPFVLLANPKLPVANIREFISYVRANPGKLNHGSNSATTMLVSELFKSEAHLDYTDVNYRGASQAINDTMVGSVQFCFVDLGSGIGPIEGGLLKGLALTSAQKYKLKPDMDTFADAGLPGTAVSAKTLILAPAGVDPKIVAQLSATFETAVMSPDVSARLQSMGQVVVGGSPQETHRELSREAAQWRTLIQEKGIRFEQ